MKKIKDILSTIWKATRYSFAFCLRNNRKDTLISSAILLIQTLLGYAMILITGNLISAVQKHLTSNQGVSGLSANDFMKWEYLFPITLFISALFIEIILRKYRQYVGMRKRHTLRMANQRETNALKASLDIGRRKSKLFDDIDKKIDELPGGWMTRIEFSEEVLDSVGSIIALLIFGTSLVFHHPFYVVILVVSSVPMVFAEFSAVGRLWKLSLELMPHNKKRSVLQGVFYGSTGFLQGIMFNQMPTLSKQIKESQDHVVEVQDRARWINLQISLGAYLLAIVGLTIVLVHCFYTTLAMGGDIGTLTIIIASSKQLQSSIRDLVLQVANQWQSVKGTIMIEEEFFGMKPLLETPNPVKPEFAEKPDIRFDSVSFAYLDTDNLVSKNISFTVEPGSKVVIIGKNGSGKSSLIGLLLRHYDPTSGNIRVGNINLRNIMPRVWSEYVCALLQNFTIFNRHIGAEIASSKLDQPVDMSEVRKASEFAGFDDVIGPDANAYSLQIGTEYGGREFSGGEEQRLALARAKYRNTPTLILDEPDAKLDPETAKRLMDNIFALKDTTVIIVTQHVARAIMADKVIVLDQGEIVETGKHDELLALGRKYASMFSKDKDRLGK